MSGQTVKHNAITGATVKSIVKKYSRSASSSLKRRGDIELTNSNLQKHFVYVEAIFGNERPLFQGTASFVSVEALRFGIRCAPQTSANR